MPCTVATSADPNGSSWKRPHASDWSKMETKRLNSASSRKDHEDIIIESSRIRLSKGYGKTHKDHVADRGHVSMSHYNISIPKAMKIREAKSALDKKWEHFRKLPAWDEFKVR